MLARSTFFACLAAVALLAGSTVLAAGKPAITKPKFDPDAPVIGLFKGMEEKKLEVKLIQKNSKTGNLLIENKTKETLTVAMPDAFVGVHVLNQLGLGGGGQQGGGQQGGGQSTGGGQQGGGQQGGGQQGGGQGFFSIPPEKLVRLPISTVCLEHGKPEPMSRMEYKVVPVEEFSTDPVLRQLLRAVAIGRVRKNVAQAAAWHLSSGKSWRELAGMRYKRAGNLPGPPTFSAAELRQADSLVVAARAKAKEAEEKGEAKPAEPKTPERGRRASR
jgi:hypothetical protein